MKVIDLDYIRGFVESNLGIVLSKNTREREYVEARALYFKICRDFTQHSFADIGKTLSKNHATVLHAINNVYPLAEAFNERVAKLYIVFKKAFNEMDYSDEEKDLADQVRQLKDKIIELNIENMNLKTQISLSDSVFEGLEKHEVDIVKDKIGVFVRVIKAQR